MTNLLTGIMIVVTVWAVAAIRASSMQVRNEQARGDELLAKLIYTEGENRVLADQARYYKAIGEKFLGNPVQALLTDEQLGRLAATITQGLASAVCKQGAN
jgi:hypothetical protein